MSALSAASPFAFSPPQAAHAQEDACSQTVVQFVNETPPALVTLQSDLAGRVASGSGITVAVVDSGVSSQNAHLGDAVVLPGVSLINDGEDPTGRSDISGHGTAIAGVIAARQVPTSGVVGLAPETLILPVRVFRSDDDESKKAGFGPDTGRIAQGIRYASDHGATIINVSMSDSVDSAELREAVSYAFGRGSLVVASAGNRNTTTETADGPRYPAAYPEALGVTAVDATGATTEASITGEQVDVAAPGQNILTTNFSVGDCIFATEAASSSFATGYASAAAALIAQRFPEEGPAGWAHRLMATASRAHTDNRTDSEGWGLIQPYEALTFVNDGSARGPVNPLFDQTQRAEVQTTALDLEQHESPLVTTQRVSIWVATLGIAATVMLVLLRRRRSTAGGEAVGSPSI
ncbi:S8 family serine peptidase [Lysinibacter cavernae]|uniref:S8 family serine peptidase n=1 Tax=Lysinibacter cavernae TaxID=1640652 RepID=UPI00360C3205